MCCMMATRSCLYKTINQCSVDHNSSHNDTCQLQVSVQLSVIVVVEDEVA